MAGYRLTAGMAEGTYAGERANGSRLEVDGSEGGDKVEPVFSGEAVAEDELPSGDDFVIDLSGSDGCGAGERRLGLKKWMIVPQASWMK